MGQYKFLEVRPQICLVAVLHPFCYSFCSSDLIHEFPINNVAVVYYIEHRRLSAGHASCSGKYVTHVHSCIQYPSSFSPHTIIHRKHTTESI
jgi:hypothetical protein